MTDWVSDCFPEDELAYDFKSNGADNQGEVAPPLQWLDMSNWDNEQRPERKWAIRDRVPANQAGLSSGEGGTGKSIIEMMKDVAHVTGKDWLGSLPEPGRSTSAPKTTKKKFTSASMTSPHTTVSHSRN
jgi:hypothetical protein